MQNDEQNGVAQGGDDAVGSPSEGPRRPPTKVAVVVAGVAIALALLVVMLAPGTQQPAPSTPASTGSGALTGSPNSAEADAAADAKVAGSAAPLSFTMKDMNGVDVKLSSFKGKPIVVNFWATWCGPCRAEIPSLVELQKKYGGPGQDLVVLGISVDDPIEKLKPYATEMKMNYPVLVGSQREDVTEAFGPLWGIPVTVFIGRDGTIHKKHSGIATKEQFEQEIKALL
jgi:thiol-disulfide isomerase/thioredoxin